MGQSVGLVSDAQGFVSTLLPGSDTPKPWSVDNKRVVYPLDEQLRQQDWSNRIGFHPLKQNVAGGESRVLEKFRERMNNYADFMFGMLLADIADLALKKDIHKDLTPAQASYLGPFSEADGKFKKLIEKFVATSRVSKKNYEFIRFSVIKGRSWQGKKRSRVAVVHFPLYEALSADNEGTTILGEKLRKVDVKMLRNMYHYLFPEIRESGHFEFGSDSQIAPSIESLMKVYGMFVKEQNKAVAILEPVIRSSNALAIVDDWRDDIENIEPYLQEIRRIPMLEGNMASERVVQANAPQMINDTPIQTATRVVAQAGMAPTLPAGQLPSQPPVQQGTQQVQQAQAPRPRFTLGVSAPTVSAEQVTHQLPNDLNAPNTTVAYARPAPMPVHSSPTVGAVYHQAQPQQQQPQQQVFQQQIAPAQLTPQAMKLPESARLINGQLYIPVEANGVNALPVGALMVDGKVMVPLANMGGAAPVMGQNVLGGQVGRVGVQQPITDPAQIPGLSEQEIQFYRGNPVMWQNYLQQLNINQGQQVAAVLAQRQNQVPRYLQTAIQQQQQQQQMQQYNGFLRR